jgi:hypothetical protein
MYFLYWFVQNRTRTVLYSNGNTSNRHPSLLITYHFHRLSASMEDDEGNGERQAPWVSSLPTFCFSVPSAIYKELHPGHVLTCASLPLLAIAYRDYATPLETLVQAALKRQRISLRELEAAEESVRRSVASAMASRALRVASYGSCGVFGLSLAAAFYVSGCQSTEEAVHRTRAWGLQARRRLDASMGIPPSSRVDDSHPEVRALRGMTEAEEMSHMHQTYFSDFDSTPEENEAYERSKNSR